MRYACEFANPLGAHHVVVVALDAHERHDVMRHLALRGPDGPGGPDGPIARAYALRHASKQAPPGFTPVLDAGSPVIRLIRAVLLH